MHFDMLGKRLLMRVLYVEPRHERHAPRFVDLIKHVAVYQAWSYISSVLLAHNVIF